MMRTPVRIIAEAGVNHNGSIDLAIELVNIAYEAGVDAVKFQTFQAKTLAAKHAPKAHYQLKMDEMKVSQREMLTDLELSHEDFIHIKKHCENLGIQFLSSAFDSESLNFLCSGLALKEIKFGSGEITNAPLLHEAANLVAKSFFLRACQTFLILRRLWGLSHMACKY